MKCYQKPLKTSDKQIQKHLLGMSPVSPYSKPVNPVASALGSNFFRSQSISRPITSPTSVKPREIKFEFASQKEKSNFHLKKILNPSQKTKKIFIIQGEYPDLRSALVERGWVENPDSNSLNFSLIWARTAKFPSKLQDWQMINHFPKNFELTAKWNFCETIKKSKNLYNENHLSFYPRSFRFFGKEIEEFTDVFRASKAIGILKAYVHVNGGFCYEKICTALAIANRWLYFAEKNLKIDHDRMLNLVHTNEWKIIVSNSASEMQGEFLKYNSGKPMIPTSALMNTVKETLALLEEKDPQFYMSGSRNIWIVKPGRKSRGRGIILTCSLEEIKLHTQNNEQWVVQKYIEHPLLINKKKFDIRQWVFVSNADPLTIWIYKDSYLRFTVENYEFGNLDNLYVHLTNNSISKNSPKFTTSESGCMWHISQFIEMLKEKHSRDYWKEEIWEGKTVSKSLGMIS